MGEKDKKNNKQDWETVVMLSLNYKEAEYSFKEACRMYQPVIDRGDMEIKHLKIIDYRYKMVLLYESAEQPDIFVGFKIDDVVYVGTLEETMSRINASIKK